MYIQLIEQVKHALEVGSLQPGDQLPTVRELASELTLAPNTIVKAYNELQRTGLIESRPGKGTMVAGNAASSVRQQQTGALSARLRGLVRDAASLGLKEDELRLQFEAEVRHVFHELQQQGETR
jgi:GntR family transcriptional regulator